jgi:hypothetical protein
MEQSEPVGSVTCTFLTTDPINLPDQLGQTNPAPNNGNVTIQTFDPAPPNLEISCVNNTQNDVIVWELMITGRSN